MKKWLKAKLLVVLIGIVVIIVMVVAGFYVFNFGDGKLSGDTGKWGEFGDYIGGTLNPILAFFSFLALCYTIHLQNKQLQRTDKQLAQNKLALEQNAKALELNNQELKNSTEQLQLSAKAQLEMEKTQRIQRFEGLFTYMANELSRMQSNLNGLSAKDMFKNSNKTIYEYTEVKNKLRSDINYSKFFIYLYQILKLIDHQDESIIPYKEKKRYSNIIRSSIDVSILQLCFLNCLVVDKDGNDFKKYKKIIEKYNFFEHMLIDFKDIHNPNNYNYAAIGLLGLYNIRVFGESDYLKMTIISIVEQKISHRTYGYKWQDLNYNRNLTFNYDYNQKTITFKETTVKDIFTTFDLKVCKDVFSRYESAGNSIQFHEVKFVFANKEFQLEILFCNGFDKSYEEIYLAITEKKFKYKTEFKCVKMQEMND